MLLFILPTHTVFVSAALAVTVTLSLSSARNMWSTYNLTKKNVPTRSSFPTLSAAAVLHHLQQCTRQESLEIFVHSARVPIVHELEGAWDGILLDNNGFVMVQLLKKHLFLLLNLQNQRLYG